MKPIKKAVFPVGGLGTRFLPATKAMPKEMLPIVDKPIIQYAFEEAIEAGIEQFIFVTGRNKDAINNHFDNAFELEQILTEKDKTEYIKHTTGWMPEPGSITFIRQQQALGLGHAIWCARKYIGDEPFAVLLADEFMVGQPGCLKQMVEKYNACEGNILASGEVLKEHTNRYGILEIDDNLKISSMVEKPKPQDAPSNLAIIGRYILQPEIFKFLEKKEKGAGGEIQLTDAMVHLLKEQDFYAVNFEGQRFDCGSKSGFIEATITMALKHNEIGTEIAEIIKKYA